MLKGEGSLWRRRRRRRKQVRERSDMTWLKKVRTTGREWGWRQKRRGERRRWLKV